MKNPSGPRTEESAQRLVDVAAIDQLAKVVAKYDLTEVEIDLGELHVRLARDRAAPSQVFAAPAQASAIAPPAPEAAAPPPGPAPDELAGAVRSPMVGTAYLRPNPESKPFVEVGSRVKAGDKLLLVEAMKTFNDIAAPRAGRIASILVADGAPVEYDQPLMVIE
ncbi:MAG TPA: acetyl-CoA carboxylase biotin carboxyl carrier protein [Roseiarcus sp.]|jgi:acetyl-CoA carboxylase biotin carboxyl carrier protein|nr:acetyl-CoA carboxylase biotin carboxyl carrier protein [Roseiarcus sp.]